LINPGVEGVAATPTRPNPKGVHMAYVCKNCGLPVWVAYLNGVLEISIEAEKDKIKDVEKCPQCENRLLTLSDLEFIPPKEAKP